MIMHTATNTIIKKAHQYCVDHGLRLTEPRTHVINIIARADKPIVAYDILKQLGDHLDNPKPPTAYRAIDFWVENGFVHRIESLNAYTICRENHKHDGSQFLICDTCGQVTETHLCHLPDNLNTRANEIDFNVTRWNVEMHGQCRDCNDNGVSRN